MTYISNSTKFIPPEKFELITQKILMRADYDLSGKTIHRVPIEDIIEFDFGLDIAWEDVSHLEDDFTDVYAFIIPEEKIIILNEAKKGLFEKYIGTLNFTYAHELGHFVLHTSAGKQLSIFEDEKILCRAENKSDPLEIQANMFAASLLIPKPILEYSIYPKIENGTICWKDLYFLRDKLEVSISALIYRLEKLNKIKVINKRIIPITDSHINQLRAEL